MKPFAGTSSATRADVPVRIRLLRPLLLNVRPAPVATLLKRLVGVQRVVTRTAVGAFFVDPITDLGAALIGEGVYEPGMQRILKRFLKPGSVFVDVGANEGFFTVLGGLLVGATGRVIAVEPQERLGPVLARNIELNALSNVMLKRVAISDRDGSADLHLSPDSNTGSSGLARQSWYWVPRQPVRTVTLAALLRDAEVKHVDLMKMDIEGFEREAVFGSPELFRDGRVHAFALELHPRVFSARGFDPQEVIDFLNDCGYELDTSLEHTLFVHRRMRPANEVHCGESPQSSLVHPGSAT